MGIVLAGLEELIAHFTNNMMQLQGVVGALASAVTSQANRSEDNRAGRRIFKRD